MKTKINNISILPSKKCTGCGACQDVCHVGAIAMREDEEGFRVPTIDANKCVDCGKCVKTCPVLSLKKNNTAKPDMYAVRASDDVRAISSSGGVFSLLANHIIEKGGYVCGAAFDNKMQLHHIMVDDKEGLAALRGSKYLQSDTSNIYRQVKERISSGKTVLFAGTPCQVAALKNFVGDNDNLYTADILCHGVPSQKSFNNYLSEISEGKEVKNVDFRNKRHGWNAEHIIVSYADGTEYDKSMREGNQYVKAFLSNMILRKSCEECPFSAFPRHGDISMGDFWGIAAYDEKQNDGKGTSIVFLNNKKGQDLFGKAVSSFAKTKKFTFSDRMPNRIKSLFKANEKRDRVLNLLKSHTLSEAIAMATQNKFDVGLVSNYCAVNFGGSLTQYALYRVLEDMGYSTIMIDRPKSAVSAIPANVHEICYNVYPYPEYALAKQYPTKEAMRELNNYCDNFVVGSDQLFQNSLFNVLGGIYTLDWVENTKRKIAYAASFGFDRVWGNRTQLDEMGYFLQQFDAFSVREESGVSLAKREFGVDAVHVLDPVFLCDPKYYDELIAHSKRKERKGYISVYMLDASEDKFEILRTASARLGLAPEVFSEIDSNSVYKERFAEFDYQYLKVEDRLQCIKDSDFFIGDSFHGTCLAILYNVPFISIVNKDRGGARFGSLLRYFGLENRMVESFEDVRKHPELFDPIDFTYANAKLKEGREFGLKWLKNALMSEKRIGASLYDIMANRLRERDKEIAYLKQLVKNLYKGKDVLLFADDVDSYIRSLATNKDKYIYVVAVRDTPGISLSEEMADRLKNALGIKQDLAQKHWKSYAAVIDEGKVVFEQIADKKIEKKLSVNEIEIGITSAALNVGNVARIRVADKDYAVNKRGLNIVVIDKENKTAYDSVCLDLHLRVPSFTRKADL